MLTPEHRCVPQNPIPPAIPFALAPARLAPIPAAAEPAPAPVSFNGQVYRNLDPALAAQLAALPPMPAPHTRRRRAVNNVPVCIMHI